MKRGLYVLLVLSAFIVSVVSCSAKRGAYDGERHSLPREIEEIVITGNGMVTLVASRKNAIEIVEDGHDLFSYRMRGKKLYVGETKGFKARRLTRVSRYAYEVIIYLSDIRDLKKIKTTGASRLYFDEPKLKLKQIELDVEGASHVEWAAAYTDDVEIDVSGASHLLYRGDFKEMEIEISGASQAEVIGRGKEAEVEVSGASRLKGAKMRVDFAKAEASGASRIVIAADRMREDVSGASSISNRW